MHLRNDSDILTGCVEANKKELIKVMCQWQRELAEEFTNKTYSGLVKPLEGISLEKHNSNYLEIFMPYILLSYFNTVNNLV